MLDELTLPRFDDVRRALVCRPLELRACLEPTEPGELRGRICGTDGFEKSDDRRRRACAFVGSPDTLFAGTRRPVEVRGAVAIEPLPRALGETEPAEPPAPA